MKKSMRVFALLLAVIMIAGLCGCSRKTENKAEEAELIAILDEIADKSGEDGAENKLFAMGALGKLIAWGKATEMKPAEIASTVGRWLDQRTPEQQAAVKAKLAQLGDAATRFGEEGGNQLMEKLGIDPSGWGESLREVIEAVTNLGK